MKQVPGLAKSIAAANPAQLVAALRHLTDACHEWAIIREQERTKRAGIEAQRDVFIEKIRSDREVLVSHLRGRFEQQGRALDGLFQALDTALVSGNPDLVGMMLTSIVETVKISPLGDMATLDQRMKDNNFSFVLGSS